MTDKRLARMSVILTHENAVGRTALNKLLFFSDVAAFIEGGHQISVSEYIKLEHGPVPDRIEEVRDYLTDQGLLRSYLDYVGSYVQHTYVAASSITRDQYSKIEKTFSDSHLEIIKRVKSAFGSMSATALSDLSHRYEPWKSAKYYGRLNFNLARRDSDLESMLKRKCII